MAMYSRETATDLRVVDQWDGGVGWVAYPDEGGQRASHAVRDDAGDVWVFDPLDAPGVDDLLAELGAVAGVVVCSDYHARDADALADRHEVAVHVPDCLDRVAERTTAPVASVDAAVAGFEFTHVRPLHAWNETVAYRERDGTLYVPDYCSSHAKFTVGDERLGFPTFTRLSPPKSVFDGMTPERILFGHGEGVFEDAGTRLADSLSGARRRFPRALVTNLPGELRAMLGAFR
ncbi:hypothetical protein [Haloarchaeobius iranensis]|uniref:Glyoxylase, beta-lactamase superfamily II n=1 Tax=Haloarchaeobius iranensis TaxID=996166 RepID=A0A1G9ZZ55_9EURY|nr:hypothetical protein [Haloarchaeobius iranensis]SDN26538.1 hypothetical protein SAMN05192554_12353 [Haloarchaeobius iranensis]